MQPSAQHVCPRCGAPIQIGQKQCARCGLALDPHSLAAWQATQTRPAPAVYQPAPSVGARPGIRRRPLILIVLGGVVGLCAICGIFGALRANDPTYQAGLTATSRAESTADAFAVQVVGTATAQARLLSARATTTALARPTDTPEPSNTPKPSSTSRPPSVTAPPATVAPTQAPTQAPTAIAQPAATAPPTAKPAAAYSATASVSNKAPARGATVIVTGTLKRNGQPVNGATMFTTWHYKSSTSSCSGKTNATGTARCSREIGGATAGYEVTITVLFQDAGGTTLATTGTSFTPR